MCNCDLQITIATGLGRTDVVTVRVAKTVKFQAQVGEKPIPAPAAETESGSFPGSLGRAAAEAMIAAIDYGKFISRREIAINFTFCPACGQKLD